MTGADRAKYFRRPIIPFLQEMQPEWILSGGGGDVLGYGVDVGAEAKDAAAFQTTKTTATQTDYRDAVG